MSLTVFGSEFTIVTKDIEINYTPQNIHVYFYNE